MNEKKLELLMAFLKDNSKNEKLSFDVKFAYKVAYDKLIEIRDAKEE